MRSIAHHRCLSVVFLVAALSACGSSIEPLPESRKTAANPNEPELGDRNAPSVLALHAVHPAAGPKAGGILLSLTGDRFQLGATVLIDGNAAAAVTVWSSTLITARLPPHAGTWALASVEVRNPDGQIVRRNDLFAYHATSFRFPQQLTELGRYRPALNVADLNQDQLPDMVLSFGERNNSLSIWPSDGQGGFRPPLEASAIPYSSLNLSDLNGDRIPDLLTWSSDTLSVRLGDGQGSFVSPPRFSAPAPGSLFYFVETNGDNNVDILSGYSTDPAILPGDGTGGFGTPVVTPSLESISNLQIIDLNNDGYSDMIGNCSNYFMNICVSLSDGANRFESVIRTYIGHAINAYAIGDWNGDGIKDLAIRGNYEPIGGASAWHLLILFGDGLGQFNLISDTQWNSLYDFAPPGDFNHDGKDDLILPLSPDYAPPRYHFSDGMGNFIPSSLPLEGRGNNLYDFNGDGLTDQLEIFDDKARIKLGNGAYGFEKEPIVSLDNGIDINYIHLKDINNDKILDLIINEPNAFHVRLGDGAGHFSADRFYAAGQTVTQVGDFAGDDNLDLLVTAASEDRVLIGDGHGGFGASATPPIPSLWRPLAVDLNNDGKDDLVYLESGGTVRVHVNQGQGTFTMRRHTLLGIAPSSVVAGDWNQDGRIDLAVSDSGSAHVSLLQGLGDGDFGSASFFVTPLIGQLVTGDWNGDEKMDLALIDPVGVRLLLAQGRGVFSIGPYYSTRSRLGSGTVGDVNGDTLPDIVLSTFEAPWVSVLLGDGRGGLTPARSFGALRSYPSAAIGDLDGDHHPDLLLFGGSYNAGIFNQYASILYNQSE